MYLFFNPFQTFNFNQVIAINNIKYILYHIFKNIFVSTHQTLLEFENIEYYLLPLKILLIVKF